MKIASSSTSFDKSLSQGDLTQLEWLHLCASSLALDGVVFEARHFPRTDDEYLAQLKKTATDIGLTVAGVAADALFEADGLRWIAVASQLGAPLVVARTPPAADTFAAWNDLVAALRQGASAAKRANVVIALRNDPKTICANPADLKRLAKDVDSSWVRYALDLTESIPDDIRDAALPRTVIACFNASSPDDESIDSLPHALRAFRAFLLLDGIGMRMTEQALGSLVSSIRFSGTSFAGVKA